MKTTDFFKGYQNLKRETREYAKRSFYANMVSQSLDFLPEGWEQRSVCGCWSIELRPSLLVDGTERSVMADEFEKVVRRISRWYHAEPSVSIDPSYMVANWYVRPCFAEGGNAQSVNIELKCGNTEKCDLIPKAVARMEYELTGYCKILSEKKFLVDA